MSSPSSSRDVRYDSPKSMPGQVMVTLRDVLEAVKLSEVDGVLNFVAFYRILRLEYPSLPKWPQTKKCLPISRGQSHSPPVRPTVGIGGVRAADLLGYQDDVVYDDKPYGKWHSVNEADREPLPFGGPIHSSGPHQGYVDLLSPVNEKAEGTLYSSTSREEGEREHGHTLEYFSEYDEYTTSHRDDSRSRGRRMYR